MTLELFIYFAVGMLIGLFIATVFYAVRWNQEYERAETAERDLAGEREELAQLKMRHTPQDWLDSDDVAVNIVGRKKLYERHPELIQPGTEVIQIGDFDGMDDTPLFPNDGRSV